MVTQKAKLLITQDISHQSWNDIYNTDVVNEKVERFQHTIKQIFIKHCPLRTVRIKEGIPIKLRRLKDKLHQKRNPAWKLIDKTLKQTYRNLRKKHVLPTTSTA